MRWLHATAANGTSKCFFTACYAPIPDACRHVFCSPERSFGLLGHTLRGVSRLSTREGLLKNAARPEDVMFGSG